MPSMRKRKTATRVLTATIASLTASGVLFAQEPETAVTAEDLTREEVYSPYADRAYPDQVLFGDTHLHTELSPDAGLLGTSLTLHEAYRFARGETVVSNTGQRVQLVRPLGTSSSTTWLTGS